jgi:hypothetical protein
MTSRHFAETKVEARPLAAHLNASVIWWGRAMGFGKEKKRQVKANSPIEKAGRFPQDIGVTYKKTTNTCTFLLTSGLHGRKFRSAQANVFLSASA